MRQGKGLPYSEVLQNDNYSIGLCVTMKFSMPIILVMVEWIGNNKNISMQETMPAI